MERKNIVIVLLAIALIFSGVGNIILGSFLGLIQPTAPPPKQEVIIATTNSVVDLDPMYAYDTASSAVIENVCETLYQINWSDSSYPIIPLLATALPTISVDGLEYTIPLRTGVEFHDGTVFNAQTAKWTFDRYAYFMNWSGNDYLPAPFNVSLPTSVLPTQTGILYETAAGLPLINRTEVTAPYELKIYLNEKKASFMALLSFYGMSMLSPNHAPAGRYYYNYEKLVGTGPFELSYILADVEQKIIRFEDYWQGLPQIESAIWVVLDDINTMNQAFLSGDVNVLLGPDKPFFAQIEADPQLDLVYAGNTFTVAWITFNVDHLDVAMRKAVAYSFNYTYAVDVIYLGLAERWPTYIPMGLQYANYSLNYPTFDRAAARNILLTDPVWGPICTGKGLSGASTDADWITVATSSPIASYNYSWNLGNTKRQAFGERLAFDLTYLGIELDVIGIAWGDLLDAILVDRHRMDLYALGWAPDYLDPENYLNPIWSNKSDINGGNFNVNYNPATAQTQILMDDALTETDPQARKLMYWEIQRRMVEEDYPGMPLISGVNWDAWVSNFHGYVSNPAGRVTFWGCYFT
ncbi:MAG: ABC transporter substrate-binding protein [Candidatus Hermodarchaeota archaeon]